MLARAWSTVAFSCTIIREAFTSFDPARMLEDIAAHRNAAAAGGKESGHHLENLAVGIHSFAAGNHHGHAAAGDYIGKLSISPVVGYLDNVRAKLHANSGAMGDGLGVKAVGNRRPPGMKTMAISVCASYRQASEIFPKSRSISLSLGSPRFIWIDTASAPCFLRAFLHGSDQGFGIAWGESAVEAERWIIRPISLPALR